MWNSSGNLQLRRVHQALKTYFTEKGMFFNLINKAKHDLILLHQSCQLFLLHLAVVEVTLPHPGQPKEHHTTVDILALARQA